jgi:transaldolase
MTDRGIRVLQRLAFYTEPQDLAGELAALRDEQSALYRSSSDNCVKAEAAELLAEAAVDLCSVLPDWHLKDTERHGDLALTDEQLKAEAETLLTAVAELGAADQVEAARAKIARIEKSNLARLTRMSMARECNTWWGNDFASGLRESMRLGAAMCTTNPQLVNIAREENPDYWTPIRNDLQVRYPDYDATQLAYAMTIEVVLYNARLLRPIWELTGGEMGYCSLQLSPKMAFNAEAMISEGKWVWEQLAKGLDGTPNCVFKLPGTKAGIAACQELTNCGMGVNITVNFSLPQQIAFAGAIEAYSNAQVSYRTQMDGRLDDPIGDELKAAGVEDWEEVKTWATTAIRQREYRLLCLPPCEGGLGFTQSIPLPASGRGPWNIDRSITSGPVPIFLTIFPPRQEEYDEVSREINPEGMWAEVPAETLEKLQKSQLFRMAYEPDGMTVDEFDTYLPVTRTLTGFSEQYDMFVEWVSSRD